MQEPITTNRFSLEEIIPEDQDFIFRGLSDPGVIPFYAVRYESFEHTKVQMDFYQYLQQTGTGRWWKIVDRTDGTKLGALGYNNYSLQHRKAEIGYWLLPEHWGNGIIKEVMPALINYLFKVVHVHRIEAMVEKGNDDSNKVLERAGFRYEGCMRDCEIKNEKFISLQIYSLLQSDV